MLSAKQMTGLYDTSFYVYTSFWLLMETSKTQQEYDNYVNKYKTYYKSY